MGQRYRFFCCGYEANAAAGDREVDEEVDYGAGAPDGNKGEDAMGARQLSWAQVEGMTGRFTSAVVGEGGFNTVYLVRLSGALAAVKVHSSSERLHRVFRQELEMLLRVHHPHNVRLLTFCDQQDEGVLVLEFAANGNLHKKLHGGGKALNVLLDASMSAKLCDFGSAWMGFSAAVRPRSSAHIMLGSPSYVDPHYIRSGVVTKKTDVYNFDVLLLELLTGMEAFCPMEGRLLTVVLAPRLKDGADARVLVDERLGSAADAAEAVESGRHRRLLLLVRGCVYVRGVSMVRRIRGEDIFVPSVDTV